MYKIIKIEDETIYVGKGSDGQFTAIPRTSFGFEPQLGDYVEFYQNGSEYIVSKVDNLANFTDNLPINGQSDKSKVAAGLLALFLGALGGYDFYIGNSKQGIIRLVITLLGMIPFLLPFFILINLIWNLIIGIQVLTSKPGNRWHKDAQGLELQD